MWGVQKAKVREKGANGRQAVVNEAENVEPAVQDTKEDETDKVVPAV